MIIRLPNIHRLHTLRMANDAAGYAQQDQAARFERLRERHTNGAAPVAVSAYQLFQTPPDLARRLVDLLNLAPGARVLEPSAGPGRLLDALAPFAPGHITAVEMAPDCARVLYDRQEPGLCILQRDFLSITPDPSFDAVAMNPPFHMRSDIRHILHALAFLKPGGTLAGLCMDTNHRERALRDIAATWEQIPAGAFSAEGTGVRTILFSIIKPL